MKLKILRTGGYPSLSWWAQLDMGFIRKMGGGRERGRSAVPKHWYLKSQPRSFFAASRVLTKNYNKASEERP